MRAGVTNTGPRMDSRSSQPRTRAVNGRPRPTEIWSALTAMVWLPCPLYHSFGSRFSFLRSGLIAVVWLPWLLFQMRSARLRLHLTRRLPGDDLLHLVLRPGDRVLGGGAGDRLRHHVRQDVGVGDELHPVRRGGGPAVGVVLHALALQCGVLGIGPQHRVVLELLEHGKVEGVSRHDVLVVHLALAEEVADPLLGGLDVLGELPDPDVPRRGRIVTPAGSAQAPMVVDAVGGDQLALLGHDVRRHRVVDPPRLALLERLVVARVGPGQHLGLHAVIEHLLVPLDGLHGARRVDLHRLAVLVHLHAAERPQHRARRRDRVVVLTDGDPHRVAHLLELFPDDVEVLPRVRDLEGGLLEEVLPVGGDEDVVVLGHRAPHPIDVRALVGRPEGLAVLLLEPGDHVRDVDELRLVEPREVHPHLHHVVPGLGLDLGGVLGLLGAHVGDVVDLQLDAGVLGEALADLGQLLVGRGGEVVPAEVADLALLAAGGSHPGGQDPGETGTGRGQELTAIERSHERLLLGEDTDRDTGSWVLADSTSRPRRLSRARGGATANQRAMETIRPAASHGSGRPGPTTSRSGRLATSGRRPSEHSISPSTRVLRMRTTRARSDGVSPMQFIAFSTASRSVSNTSGSLAPLGAQAVRVLMAVGFQSILSASRRVVKSALPMPVALPPLSSVRSRATIQRIFGSAGNGSWGFEGRPMTLVSMPEPEMFLPISSTIRTSMAGNGRRAIQARASLSRRRSPASRSAALKASTHAVSS